MTEQELAQAIWSIKEIIRDDYQDAEVEDVILPFTVLRRLDCVLKDKYEPIKKELDSVDPTLRDTKLKALLSINQLTFYNGSGFSLEKLIEEPSKITENFKTYLNGFTNNVKNILLHFVTKTKDDSLENDESADITEIYKSLAGTGLLFQVTETFAKLDLSPDKVSNAQMGTIFEIVIQRSKETTNAKAGQYFTPREVVHLLVSLVMAGKEKELATPGKIFNIYDPCCGTGGMLTEGKNFIRKVSGNPKVKVNLYGQELNHKTYAIAKADLLLKGDLIKDDQIRQGNTLSDDKQPRSFNYMLANPPFGTDWSKIEKQIKAEAANPLGRYAAGLPSTSDGSMLFLQHMVSKMDINGSRIGIVLNGSPLFNGDAGSGWSGIRKMLLDRNLLDCIVALPKNLFYGTDITTYLWILDNKRPAERRDKCLFIDASDKDVFAQLLQRNIGKKRFEISTDGINKILNLYRNYQNASINQTEIAKLLDYDDFRYTKVAVRRPSRLVFEGFSSRLKKEFSTLPRTAQKELEKVKGIDGLDCRMTDAEFFAALAKKTGKKPTAAFIAQARRLAETDPDAVETYREPGNKKSGLLPDTALNDSENIPMKQDIDEYFKREVLRFLPDAWLDRSEDKIGVEFPFTKLFYVYKPLRTASDIFADLKTIESQVDTKLKDLMKNA